MLNWPAFDAEKSTFPLIVPLPSALTVPVPPTPIFPVLVPCDKCNGLPAPLVLRMVKFRVSPPVCVMISALNCSWTSGTNRIVPTASTIWLLWAPDTSVQPSDWSSIQQITFLGQDL